MKVLAVNHLLMKAWWRHWPSFKANSRARVKDKNDMVVLSDGDCGAAEGLTMMAREDGTPQCGH